ncbi:MAG: hypothetical protein AAFU77_03880 [Myxococcota bacterium]
MQCKRTFLCLSLLSACAIDTQPVPDETDPELNNRDEENGGAVGAPGADSSMLLDPTRVFHSGESDGTGPRLIAGLPGTVSLSVSELRFENPGRPEVGTRTRAPAEDGSFAVTFDAVAGETVRIVLLDANSDSPQVLDSTAVILQAPSPDARSLSADLEMFFETPADFAASPDASGLSTLSLPPGSVEGGAEFVVANVTAGNAESAISESNGALLVRIAAMSGDQLEVFAIDAAASNGGGTAFSYVVP